MSMASGSARKNETANPYPVSTLQGAHDFQINGGSFNNFTGDMHSHYGDVHVHHHCQSTQSAPPTPSLSVRENADRVLKLIPPDMSRIVHMGSLEKRAPSTGAWIFKNHNFQIWLEPSHLPKLIWAVGIPGAGKTIIASVVIQKLENLTTDAGDISVAFVYIRYSDETTLVDIMLCLVRQQLERHPRIASVVEPLFTRHKRENTRPSQEQLQSLLREICKFFKRTFYSIDGLDEAPARIQLTIVKVLSSVGADIFLASRHLPSVEKQFPEAIFLEVKADRNDIKYFVGQEIASDAGLQELLEDPEDRQEVINSIADRCGGMFLHAALQVESLRDCLTVAETHEKVAEFPSEMSALYVTTMGRVCKQPHAHVRVVKLALIWLIYSRAPLTVDDLRYALAFNPTSRTFPASKLIPENRLVPLFCGLITVDKTSRHVRLIHYTAKDMLDKLLSEEPEAADPYAMIATTCIARMASCNFHDSDLATNSDLKRAFGVHPLLKYAFDEWAACAQAAENPDARTEALAFIKDCSRFPFLWDVRSPHGTLDHLQPLHVAAWFNVPSFFGAPTTADEFNFTASQRDTLYSELAKRINNATAQSGVTPLMLAADAGHESIVRELVGFPNLQINSVSVKDGSSALGLAAANGHEKVVVTLLDTPGVDVNIRSIGGWSPLMSAARNGCEGVVRRLLNMPGVHLNAVNADGWSALMLAAVHAQEGVMKQLLAAPGIYVDLPGEIGAKPLRAAAKRGNGEMARLLLAVDVEVNLPDEQGRTALMITAMHGHVGVARPILADIRTDLNLVNMQGQTALVVAAVHGHGAIVGALLETPGTNIHCPDGDGRTAMLWAAHNGSVDIMRSLVQFSHNNDGKALEYHTGTPQPTHAITDVRGPSIDINATDNDGCTALMLASKQGYREAVNFLLQLDGIDVNIVNAAGQSAFALAFHAGHGSILRALIGHAGSDLHINLLSAPHRRASLLTLEHGPHSLLKLGGLAKHRLVDEDGWTVLMHAAALGRDRLVQRLLDSDYAVQINAVNNDGKTALMLALENGHWKTVVQHLLGFPGVRVDIVDKNGETALDCLNKYVARRGREAEDEDEDEEVEDPFVWMLADLQRRLQPRMSLVPEPTCN